MTEEAVANYGGHNRDIGTIVTVHGFEIKDGDVTVDLNLGARRIDIDIARRMRLAWLEREGSK